MRRPGNKKAEDRVSESVKNTGVKYGSNTRTSNRTHKLRPLWSAPRARRGCWSYCAGRLSVRRSKKTAMSEVEIKGVDKYRYWSGYGASRHLDEETTSVFFS